MDQIREGAISSHEGVHSCQRTQGVWVPELPQVKQRQERPLVWRPSRRKEARSRVKGKDQLKNPVHLCSEAGCGEIRGALIS